MSKTIRNSSESYYQVPLSCANIKSATEISGSDSIGETAMPIMIRCAYHSPVEDEYEVQTMIGTVSNVDIRYTPLRP